MAARHVCTFLILALLVFSSCATTIEKAVDKARVYHVVLCWLKEPGNAEGRQQIIEVSKTFKAIPGVIGVKAGASIPSDRTIVDSFDVGILLTFADQKAMQTYLDHPDHKQTVQNVLKPLVSKIVVYDFTE